MDITEAVKTAVELRLAHDRTVADRFALQEKAIEAAEKSATAWLEAESALSHQEYVDYQKEYNRRRAELK